MKYHLSVFNVGWWLPIVLNRQNLISMQFDRTCKALPLQISIVLLMAVIIYPHFAYADSGSVQVNEVTFDIDYDVLDISVLEFDTDMQWPALLVSVDAPSSGTLSITLEDSLLNSIYSSVDGDFEVLLDGEFGTFEEMETTTTHRLLTINVSAGTEEILIGIPNLDMSSPDDVSTDETSTGNIQDLLQLLNLDLVSEDSKIQDPTSVEDPGTAEDGLESPVESELTESIKENATNVEMDEEMTSPSIDMESTVDMQATQCGPGTILEDDICVLLDATSSVPTESELSPSGLMSSGGQLVYGIVGAFIVAGGIAAVLGLISKARKNSNTS